jgi:hypothetical protein
VGGLQQTQAVADDDADHHRSDDERKGSEGLILREAAERQVRDLLGLTLRDFVQPTDRREQRNEKNQTDRNGGDEQSNPSVFKSPLPTLAFAAFSQPSLATPPEMNYG